MSEQATSEIADALIDKHIVDELIEERAEKLRQNPRVWAMVQK